MLPLNLALPRRISNIRADTKSTNEAKVSVLTMSGRETSLMKLSRPHHRIQDFFLQKSVYFVSRKHIVYVAYYEPTKTIVTKTITKGKECLSIWKQRGLGSISLASQGDLLWDQSRVQSLSEDKPSVTWNMSLIHLRFWTKRRQVADGLSNSKWQTWAISPCWRLSQAAMFAAQSSQWWWTGGPKAAHPPKCPHMRNSALGTPEPLETKERFHSRVCAHGKWWRTKMLGRWEST